MHVRAGAWAGRRDHWAPWSYRPCGQPVVGAGTLLRSLQEQQVLLAPEPSLQPESSRLVMLGTWNEPDGTKQPGTVPQKWCHGFFL